MLNERLLALKAKNIKKRTYSDYLSIKSLINSSSELDLPTIKIAVLRNFTVEPLIPILEVESLMAGFLPKIFVGEFDNLAQDVMGDSGSLYQFDPDFIVILNWLDTLSPLLSIEYLSHSSSEIEKEIMRLRQYFADMMGSIRKKSSAPILLNNFPASPESTLGILDSQGEYQRFTINLLNREILFDMKKITDVYILDFEKIFSENGFFNCYDSRNWQISKLPLRGTAILSLSDLIARFIKALRGKSKKCLVLDCDNTLWGGVIGEDGLSGIELGKVFPGLAFSRFQQEILNLKERGVILALCSKNNETDVLNVLKKHPDMLIKEECIATSEINWQDKATNIKKISKDLNIGLDSIVFVDDSKFECDLVKGQLPEVEVIHLTGNISEYTSLLLSSGHFDSLTFTSEDRLKNKMYREAKVRKEIEISATSIDNYLKDLNIELTVGRANSINIPRCSQLTQKTNQFNLTTIRYGEGQIEELSKSEFSDVFYLKVKDKISDLGLVGVAIVRYERDLALIDSFMMSCRALGRGCEVGFLSKIVGCIKKEKHINKIKAIHAFTEKNYALVGSFYLDQGFQLISENEKMTEWLLVGGNVNCPDWLSIYEELDE